MREKEKSQASLRFPAGVKKRVRGSRLSGGHRLFTADICSEDLGFLTKEERSAKSTQ